MFEIVVIMNDKKHFLVKTPVIVPRDMGYITSNNAQLQQFVRYSAPPYTLDNLKLIESVVKGKLGPPQDWPSFECERKVITSEFK